VSETDAGERLIESLRDLIRIPSVNPPAPPGPELAAAHYLRDALGDVGVHAEVFEPVPGRGSVVARLRGDGTGGPPLLLLSHLDVVPAPPERWTHDPFAADIADGYVYGRGAVDMKHLVAMELEVMLRLAEEARAAGRDPASDPIPGLRRDVLFASTADEEAGGLAGAGWLALEHPEHLQAAAAINEAGGVSMWLGDRRLYPIQVAEKGYAVYRITIRGTAGHRSMPRPDNAALLAAEAITRLGKRGPFRLTPTMATFFDEAEAAVDPAIARILRAIRSPSLQADAAMGGGGASAQLCSPVYIRVADALVRDTISPNIVHAGVKYNVIPGEAIIEIDCRQLPGTTEAAMEATVRERLGPDLLAVSTLELIIAADPVVAPIEGGLYPILAQAIRDHDPEGVPVPIMAPFATDAKHLVALGVPSYGFSPLRQDRDETFIDRYHSVDERVSLAGLRWGLPVLYDAVRRFCG
jgi:acetylornithine deacetylase/succinyl-diaminopimelate desuccinylase-like protein